MKNISAQARLNPDLKQLQPLPLLPGQPTVTANIPWLAEGPMGPKFADGKKSSADSIANRAAVPSIAALRTPVRVWRLF